MLLFCSPWKILSNGHLVFNIQTFTHEAIANQSEKVGKICQLSFAGIVHTELSVYIKIALTTISRMVFWALGDKKRSEKRSQVNDRRL